MLLVRDMLCRGVEQVRDGYRCIIFGGNFLTGNGIMGHDRGIAGINQRLRKVIRVVTWEKALSDGTVASILGTVWNSSVCIPLALQLPRRSLIHASEYHAPAALVPFGHWAMFSPSFPRTEIRTPSQGF